MLFTRGSQHLSIKNNVESYCNNVASYFIEYNAFIIIFIYEVESDDDNDIVNFTVTVGTEVVEYDSTSNHLSEDECLDIDFFYHVFIK